MNILTTRLHRALENPATKASRLASAFHPSSASIKTIVNGEERVIGACLRQQWYRMKEPKVSNTGVIDYTISANIGDKLHELIVNYIENYGYTMGLQKVESEHPIFLAEENISGRCDLLAWDYVNNELVGIEVKSLGEYKCNVCMESPAPEHIMQSMIYLYAYDKEIPPHMTKPKKWYIWYISRTENWSIKAKKHNSPLQMLWDYYITLDKSGVPTVYTPSGVERWEHFNISKILDRYKLLATHIKNDELPPRDFKISYTEEDIMTAYKAGRVTKKAEVERIEKWVSKGCPSDKLKIEMGDAECSFCPWKDHCWGIGSGLKDIPKYNLPATTTQPVKSNTSNSQGVL